MNHPRKMLIKKYEPNRWSYEHDGWTGTTMHMFLKTMFEYNMFASIPERRLLELHWSFKPSNNFNFNVFRQIEVPNKVSYKRARRIQQDQLLFGYEPKEDEIDKRLDELQHAVNMLPLRHPIDVRNYYKFSDLMQKIMYEYGCFEGVYQISGEYAKQIREKLIFPKTRTYNDQPLYLNQKLYYLDINGAYMAMVKRIPTGLDVLNPTAFNYKIKDLIEQLYEMRQNASPELNKTLKFLMNSCYGYSIKRPQSFSIKRSTPNLDDPYLYGYDSKFTVTMKSVVSSFTVPHFAKEILNEFKEFMDNIKRKVTVYYENIDAILVTESDYNKLIEEGLIGKKLGQFKIEHIFTEIAIASPRKYIAKLENGEYIFHCVKPDTDINEFINSVKGKIYQNINGKEGY